MVTRLMENKYLLFISISVQTQDWFKTHGLRDTNFCNTILLVHSTTARSYSYNEVMPLHRFLSFPE